MFRAHSACRELKNRINKSIKSGASSWFSARNGGLKLLCALVCWHDAKANCILKIQVFFLDYLLRVLLKTPIHMAE
jgi:hypothetical protein